MTLGIAHRAGNDVDSLRAALELGADVVEADVHSRAGRLEVRHHKALGPLPYVWDREGRPGRVPLLRDRWEVRPAAAFPLQLAELLAAAAPDTTLMLDLKGVSGVGPATLHLLAEHPPAAPVLVCARWWPSALAFTDIPWARPVLSARGRGELLRLRRLLNRGSAPHGVSVHRSLLDRDIVRALHERVGLVMTWPIDDLADLEAVLSIGVTGVITNEAEVLHAVVGLRAAD